MIGTHVIIGMASDCQYGDLVPDYRGTVVTPWRKCINQDTIICKTEDGRDLWVDLGGLKKIE